MKSTQNIVGPKVRRIRFQRGWTQEQLAARCTIRGFELSRATLSKIEARLRCVTDMELIALAKALECSLGELFQSHGGSKKRICFRQFE
jgi:transcriptional regulator with XRE-family HTH domain